MAYTYDTDNFIPSSMMFGSTNIKTLESINGNFKILTCSEIGDFIPNPVTFPIGGMPLVWDRLPNGSSALRIIDYNEAHPSIPYPELIYQTFQNTVLNGCSVRVASNDHNNFLLNMQKLSDFESEPYGKSTCFSGVDWQLDPNNSIVVSRYIRDPIIDGVDIPLLGLRSFMFGNKTVLCGRLQDGYSPLVKIDELAVSGSDQIPEEPIWGTNWGATYTSWNAETTDGYINNIRRLTGLDNGLYLVITTDDPAVTFSCKKSVTPFSTSDYAQSNQAGWINQPIIQCSPRDYVGFLAFSEFGTSGTATVFAHDDPSEPALAIVGTFEFIADP